MRQHSFRAICAAALAVLTYPVALAAQERWPVSAEVHFGYAKGYSNTDAYLGERTGAFGDILVGMRVHATDRSGGFVALGLAAYVINLEQADSCDLAPNGECRTYFPGFAAVSALAGWEPRSTDLHLLAGPSFVVEQDGNESTAGLTVRFDAALPLFWHIAGSGTINTLFVPAWNGDLFFHMGLGAGLRIR